VPPKLGCLREKAGITGGGGDYGRVRLCGSSLISSKGRFDRTNYLTTDERGGWPPTGEREPRDTKEVLATPSVRSWGYRTKLGAKMWGMRKWGNQRGRGGFGGVMPSDNNHEGGF